MGREVGRGIRMGRTHVNPWLNVNVWQRPLQYGKVISLQLIKINQRKKEESNNLNHKTDGSYPDYRISLAS